MAFSRTSRIIVVLLAVVVCALLGELLLRLALGPPARFLFGRSFHDVQSDWDIVYGVTDDGTRETCDPSPDIENRPRVAVIGDSFVFGQGVHDCQDLVSHLGSKMPTHRFENFGVIGGGIQEYLLIVRDFIDDQEKVVIVFYGNDVGRLKVDRSFFAWLCNQSSLAALTRKAYRAIIVRRALRALRTRRGEQQTTGKIALVNGKPNNILSSLQGNPVHFRSMVEPDPRRAAVFRELFDELAARLKNGIGRERVLVTVVPQGHTVSRRLRDFITKNGGSVAPFGSPGPAYELIRALAIEHGLRFVDVFPQFLAAGDNLYHPHDLHWSVAGHDRMSELLLPYLKGSGD